MALSANSSYVFSGSSDKTVRIWSVNSGECLHVLEEHEAAILGVSVNGTRLISVDRSGVIIEWNISDIKSVSVVKIICRHSWEQALSFVRNTAENVYGLSQQNQRLFEQHKFTPRFKESRLLQDDSYSNISSTKIITKLEAEVSSIKRDANKQQYSAISNIEQHLVSLKDRLISYAEGLAAEEVIVPVAVSSSSLSSAVISAPQAPSQNSVLQGSSNKFLGLW